MVVRLLQGVIVAASWPPVRLAAACHSADPFHHHLAGMEGPSSMALLLGCQRLEDALAWAAAVGLVAGLECCHQVSGALPLYLDSHQHRREIRAAGRMLPISWQLFS